MLLEAGIPLDALGVQSHINGYPDIALFQVCTSNSNIPGND